MVNMVGVAMDSSLVRSTLYIFREHADEYGTFILQVVLVSKPVSAPMEVSFLVHQIRTINLIPCTSVI